MFIMKNPNPINKFTSDCVVRALCLAQNQSWDDTYWELCEAGFQMGDWGSSNAVWGAYLKNKGFMRYIIPNTCPYCYTVKQFCIDNPLGTYILATGSHVICIIDGNYLDTWDSGDEVPIYYWKKER